VIAVDRFFRNPDTGELVVAQLPNPPLLAWLAGTALQLVVEDSPLLDAVTSLALIWWAILELVEGESPFRRVLGAVVLVATTFA
jgi:hypothetical protein